LSLKAGSLQEFQHSAEHRPFQLHDRVRRSLLIKIPELRGRTWKIFKRLPTALAIQGHLKPELSGDLLRQIIQIF